MLLVFLIKTMAAMYSVNSLKVPRDTSDSSRPTKFVNKELSRNLFIYQAKGSLAWSQQGL